MKETEMTKKKKKKRRLRNFIKNETNEHRKVKKNCSGSYSKNKQRKIEFKKIQI